MFYKDVFRHETKWNDLFFLTLHQTKCFIHKIVPTSYLVSGAHISAFVIYCLVLKLLSRTIQLHILMTSLKYIKVMQYMYKFGSSIKL